MIFNGLPDEWSDATTAMQTSPPVMLLLISLHEFTSSSFKRTVNHSEIGVNCDKQP